MKAHPIMIAALLLVAAGAAFAAGAEESVAGQTPVGMETGELIVYNTPADYQTATGRQLPAYNEAPALAAMVADGSLPR